MEQAPSLLREYGRYSGARPAPIDPDPAEQRPVLDSALDEPVMHPAHGFGGKPCPSALPLLVGLGARNGQQSGPVGLRLEMADGRAGKFAHAQAGVIAE